MASFDPITDVMRAHDAGLVLLSGPLECPGHVLLPWFARAALHDGGGGGDGDSGAAAPSSLVVLAAAHPPSAHAAALRKVQQQQPAPAAQRRSSPPLPVLYVEPRFPGPGEGEEEEEEEGAPCGGGGQGGGAPWLRRLATDLASAVRQQATAAGAGRPDADAAQQRRRPPPPPPQITVLVDSLTALAAAADAGVGTATPAALSSALPPTRAHLDWLAFLHALLSLESQAPSARVRVVALCAADVAADAAWRRWLRHRAALALSLSPVEGRTAGLDGELRAEARAAPRIGGGGASAAFAPVAAGGGIGAWGWGSAAGLCGGSNGRCFFRASELSVRWLSDVQSADLMR